MHPGENGEDQGVDIFISYQNDEFEWATWVAEVAEGAGLTVAVQIWDAHPGQDFVEWINHQLGTARYVAAIASRRYFQSEWCHREWTAALAKKNLLLLRVEDDPVPPVLSSLVYADLFGVDRDEARSRLLRAIALRTADRRAVGGFPGGRYGRSGDLIFDVPLRLRRFRNRVDELSDMHRLFEAGEAGFPTVVALTGIPGVGKTQLAIEYAQRYREQYDVVWWIPAQDRSVLVDRISNLGVELGIAITATDDGVAAIMRELAARDRWLLVFDNLEGRAALASVVPRAGTGHVLLTARDPGWAHDFESVKVPVLRNADAAALLRQLAPGMDARQSELLSAELDGLPLALVQAAAAIDESGMSPDTFRRLLRAAPEEVLADSAPSDYPTSLAASWHLALEALRRDSSVAFAVLAVTAHLAPEPIPTDWLTTVRPQSAPDGTDNPLEFHRAIGLLRRRALATVTAGDVQVHRLAQMLTLRNLSDAESRWYQEAARTALATARPGDPADLDSWPIFSALLPHVLVADLAQSPAPEPRSLLLVTVDYLRIRGHSRISLDLALAARSDLSARLGPDHSQTLQAGQLVALALFYTGDYAGSAKVNRDLLERRRRVLGKDHPDTLQTANNYAYDLMQLGELQLALTIDEDVWARRERLFGPDHPGTLQSASGMALDLHLLGDLVRARPIYEQTLGRRQAVLGENNIETLRSMNAYACLLHDLGEVTAARAAFQEVYDRRTAVLGPDHQETWRSAEGLAYLKAEAGDFDAAVALLQDVVRRREAAFGPDQVDTVRAMELLSDVKFTRGDLLAALAIDRVVYARRATRLPLDHQDLKRARHNLAVTLRGTGSHSDGEADLQRMRPPLHAQV